MPDTKAGREMQKAGLHFHSGRRLADYPGLIDRIEAEAVTAALDALAAKVEGLTLGPDAIAEARLAWEETRRSSQGAWDIGFKQGWDDAAEAVLALIAEARR